MWGPPSICHLVAYDQDTVDGADTVLKESLNGWPSRYKQPFFAIVNTGGNETFEQCEWV